MHIRVVEIKCFDTGCCCITFRNCLRCGGYMHDHMFSELCIGFIHIANDDGYMLKNEIVTHRIFGNTSSSTGDIISQFDLLVAKLHSHNPHTQAEKALELLVL